MKLATVYSRVLRYSPEVEEAGFHQGIHENPHSVTPVYAYADWLAEHDRPGLASILSLAADKAGEMRDYVERTSGKTEYPVIHFHHNNHNKKEISVRYFNEKYPNTEVFVTSETPSLHDPSRVLYTSAWYPSHEAAKEGIENLRKEGYSLMGVDHLSTYNSDAEYRDEERAAKLVGLPRLPRQTNE